MTVTREEAREVLARLRLAQTTAQAAHGCAVELRAIEPYTCGTLARVRHLLRTLERIEDAHAAGLPDRRWTPEAWTAQIAKIAESAS